MQRLLKYLFYRRFFNDPPGIHDGHPVGNIGMDSHIVGDHHNGVMLLCLDILEKLNHTPLDHNIQGSGRFIGEDQPRL
jgi:hypothetical protein